jgi:plastocyanin
MRHAMTLVVGSLLATSLLFGCSDKSPTGPSTGGGTGGGVTSPGTGGGGTSGGGTSGGSSIPTTAAVTLGDIFFKSDRNGTSNPAVDTVAVNGTVTWTWGPAATMPHSVQSLGTPSFTSSAIQTGIGSMHQVTFGAPGTYQYDCAIHGQLMTGTIVVMASAAPTM